MDNNIGIYTITNIITIEKYVGSAVNYPSRTSKHKSMLQKGTHPNYYLQEAYNKYGPDNFIFEIIEYVEDKNNLIVREQYYIDTLKPIYNIRKIADSNLGLHHTKESKLKMSESHRGDKHPMYGKHHTEEAKLKVSESLKGNKRSLGHKQSEEHVRNHAEAVSKPFKLLSPQNQIIEGMNLAKFCRDNNLNSGAIWQVINNKQKHHKGWTKI